MTFTLPDLPYAYDALEPHIDTKTMEIHHTKHHAGYTNKLNTAIEGTALENMSIEELLTNPASLPEEKRQHIQNNGGGYYNHCLFWESLSPEKTELSGDLKAAIEEEFGSYQAFVEVFTKKALGLFGSGWTYLCMDSARKLSVKRCSFQETPLKSGLTPLLGLDVWEHAYYLNYQNKRAEYVGARWNIINRDVVQKRFKA